MLWTSFVRYGRLEDVFCMLWMSFVCCECLRYLFYVMEVLKTSFVRMNVFNTLFESHKSVFCVDCGCLDDVFKCCTV